MNVIDVAIVTALASGSAPVVDIDGTMWIQLGTFLLLMFILQPLLFKPWLETRQRRIEAIDGALESATALRERADAVQHQYDTQKAEAERAALELRSHERREAETTRQQALTEARAEAAHHLETAREQIAKQGAVARESLQRRVDELAQHVANKILRRAS
ncbi:MAG: ATP synthase F0 subunit B [Myxococcales bacterium]|nr:ATP synthase F0 subunit B [Myxococcales bacterium]